MTFYLPGAECYANLVRILEEKREVVVAGPDGSNRPPASPDCINRLGIHNPTHHVECVNILLGNNVTGQYLIQPPCPQTILRIIWVVPPRIVHTLEWTTCMVNRLTKNKLSQCTISNTFKRFNVELIGAGLKIHKEALFIPRRLPAAFSDTFTARYIHGDGLGDIYMLTGVHPGSSLLRMKIRRTLNRYCIDLFNEPAVTKKAGITPGLRNIEFPAAIINPVLEIIRNGNDIVSAMLFKQTGYPRPPAAAANYAQVNL